MQFVWKLLYPLCGQMKVLLLQKPWNNEDICIDPSVFLFYLKLIPLVLQMAEHKSFPSLPAGGNSDGNFGLSLDGELKLYKDLDREEIPVYSIIIKASSNRSWTPPRGQRAARAKALDPARDPSLLEVRIELEDINDQKPRFTKVEYTAGNLRSCICVYAGLH